MNILFIAQNYNPFIGGVETQAQLLARELSKRNNVSVAAGNFRPCRLPKRLAMLHTNVLTPAYGSYQDGKVPVHSLTPGLLDRLRMAPIALRATPKLQSYAYHSLNRFGFPWFCSVYKPRLKQLMKNADVVHSLAGGYLGWSAQRAAKDLAIPFVSTPYAHPGQWGDGPDDVAYYQRADAVIALLKSDREFLASIGVRDERLHVVGVVPIVPETTDPAAFRQRYNLGDRPVILYIGRMMVQKGAAAIAQAASRVWERQPKAQFVFIGPATTEEAEIFEGADPRIHYLGQVSDQEKGDALSACDLFCMPSTSEILPAVYLEAWSFGKPIIGGKAHGLPELIEGCGGGVTATHDPDELSDAIVRLLNDSERRNAMGKNGQELVRKEYSLEAVAGSLEALYSRLGAARKAHGIAGGLSTASLGKN